MKYLKYILYINKKLKESQFKNTQRLKQENYKKKKKFNYVKAFKFSILI